MKLVEYGRYNCFPTKLFGLYQYEKRLGERGWFWGRHCDLTRECEKDINEYFIKFQEDMTEDERKSAISFIKTAWRLEQKIKEIECEIWNLT
ncbi:hypothetical protein UFOVP1361_30 [uncultured Caudovirales phage]|uniref:Uncharacterized protein n=1 Tax=uncultured Caudovirales phage TaxID=2100421 RepID=A0A6J5S4Q2_9CAUD|nr:hypothetical protein UFOVP1361_30 [uncultured Caudovirales phage]